MSRHTRLIKTNGKEFEVTVGFDRPTQSAFFQIFDANDEDFIADDSTHSSLKDALSEIGLSQAAMEELIQPMVRVTISEMVQFSINPDVNLNTAVRYETATV